MTGQVQAGLAGLTAEQVGGLVIAYEPIWAIGTGRTASAEDAQAVCALVRDGGRRAWPAPRPPRRCASSTAAR